MPKIKTHSGLKKRLKRTGSGKLKRSHAYISHLSHNKTHKQKKHLAKATVVSASDYKRIKSRLVKNKYRRNTQWQELKVDIQLDIEEKKLLN